MGAHPREDPFRPNLNIQSIKQANGVLHFRRGASQERSIEYELILDVSDFFWKFEIWETSSGPFTQS